MRIIINQFVVFLLIVFSASTAFTQESEFKFIWHNQVEEKQAGYLKIDVITNPEESEIVLNIKVEWHDSKGKIITKSGDKPLIYLSEYDFEILSNTNAYCKTFSNTDKNDLFFSDFASLVFGYTPTSIDNIEYRFKFQYAFSEEDIYSAKTRVIDYPSGTKLILKIPAARLKRVKKQINQEINEARDKQILSICNKADSGVIALHNKMESLQTVIDSLDYQHIITLLDTELSSPISMDSLRIHQIKSILQQKLLESDGIMEEIDGLFFDIRAFEKTLVSDNMPPDSLLSYQSRAESISRRIKTYYNDFLDYRRHIRALQDISGVKAIPNDLGDQRIYIEQTYIPKFESQIDSLNDVRVKHDDLMIDLDSLLSDFSSSTIESENLGSLINQHHLYKNELTAVRTSHRISYLNYLDLISKTRSVAKIEGLHLTFEDTYIVINQLFAQVDSDILDMERKVVEVQNQRDYTLLWIGGGVLLVFLTVILIRTNQVSKANNGISSSEQTRSAVIGDTSLDFEGELLNGESDFYPFIVSESTESVIQEVHFSFRAIKAMNQIVHGAISRKKPTEFGGYFFGRQYHVSGKGHGHHIVMIDNVVSSVSINPEFHSGVTESEDLVEEMNKVVGKNNKKALLGWFSSAGGADIEMGEDLIKLHRTYFRDKWQIALLVNSTTDNLHSAIFLKRKTGFFESTPGEDCHLSLDDLYQHSLNPLMGVEKKIEREFPENEYKELILNQNWCDSIVRIVSFHKSVVEVIMKEVEESKLKESNQIASGFFYGQAEVIKDETGQQEFKLSVNRYIAAVNGESPREIPGVTLLGWLNLGSPEIFESLKSALPYHKKNFPKAHQISVIVNTSTSEFRIFSQKHNLELNNNTIETEEFNLDVLSL
ncbi:MAG: hypothetical protein KAH17_04335 [Bacteroidales bacterium]|nr:hypothetical protein [Bacteroidales bacterium]